MTNVDFWLVLKNQMVWQRYLLDVLCFPFHVKETLYGFCLTCPNCQHHDLCAGDVIQ